VRTWRGRLELSGGSYTLAYSDADAAAFAGGVIDALCGDGPI
jgi:hypothetical protein